MKFLVIFLFLGSGTLRAQWPTLGSSEDSLIAKIGKPDSSDDRFDYFHSKYLGLEGTLRIETNSDGEIQQHVWSSQAVSSSQLDSVMIILLRQIDSAIADRYNTVGNRYYRIWANNDSLLSLACYDSTIEFGSFMRSFYYGDFNGDEPLTDSFFSIGETAYPLDSESRFIVRVWKQFLELPTWDEDKYFLWSRYDNLIFDYFRISGCPDYSSSGYKAKLNAIVKDREFDAYILSTVYSPEDSSNSAFPWWKRSSRQITYFTREDGHWKITSALPFVTRGWKKSFWEPVEFHSPENQRFDSLRARKAVRFVDSIAHIFGVPTPRYIDYYYGFGGISTYSLLGLDVPDYNLGVHLHGEPVILVADTIEDNLHELTHAILSSYFATSLITEGIATFLANDTADNRRIILFADSLIKTSDSFEDAQLKDSTRIFPYAIGLVLFQDLYKRGGMNEVVAFFKDGCGDMGFEKALKKYFHTSMENFDEFCTNEIRKAASKLTKH